MKEEIEEIFKSDSVNEFDEMTPENNRIKGRILLNRGEYHGSLIIESVNDKKTWQFVRGFPKIKYFESHMEKDMNKIIKGYEKLDGTCIGIFKLKDEKGNVIEHVAKSRQKAVLEKHFIEMLKFCDLRLIYKQNLDVVYLELFGMLNEHTIPHKQTYIDVRLIGAVKDDKLFTPDQLQKLSQTIQIDLPREFVTITKIGEEYEVTFKQNIFMDNVEEYKKHNKIVYFFQDVIDCIKEYLDYCNNIYYEEKNCLKYEGIVIQNTKSVDNVDTIQYLKVKPDTFLDYDEDNNLDIPLVEIRKEVLKIINENLSLYAKGYHENDVINEINEALKEEYDKEIVETPKIQKVIRKELQKQDYKIKKHGLYEIIDEILEEFGPDYDAPIGDMMKWFAQKYPSKRKKSRDVYAILDKHLKSMNKKL